MKKIILSTIIILAIGATAVFAQGPIGKGEKQLNFGVGFSGNSVPIYVGVDFGVHPDITVGPRVGFRTHRTTTSSTIGGIDFKTETASRTLGISFNADYHFNNVLDISSKFDFYAGAKLGYSMFSSSTTVTSGSVVKETSASGSNFGVSPQIGGRYFFNSKWSLNLQSNFDISASQYGLFLGMTMKL